MHIGDSWPPIEMHDTVLISRLAHNQEHNHDSLVFRAANGMSDIGAPGLNWNHEMPSGIPFLAGMFYAL